MFYWRVRAGFRNANVDKDIIPENVVCLVRAPSATDAIVKFYKESPFAEFDMFITAVDLAPAEE